ncbi:MAG: RNA-binding S4 domain-containing protein [Crocinitomicaceae bacterium]|nr:RNA-binding S4 domain-containing protein [Crocinitomicaceae bacterium]
MNTKGNGRNKTTKTGKSTTSKSKQAAPKSAAKSTKKTTDKSHKVLKAKSRFVDFKEKQKKGDPLPSFNEDSIRLNKYLSNAGICSRREADVLIATGVVSVNGKVVTELGYKIAPTDVVKYDEETIRAEVKRYVLLNKPKGFVMVANDPLNKKAASYLVKKACKERIYPVDRLDKETSGLILYTNDGDLAKKLIHPQRKASQLFDVSLNKPLKKEDFEKLKSGVELEDGTSRFEQIEFTNPTFFEIGVKIRNTKNQIIRRTFESLGYKVEKLDRVAYADLDKKDLPRGYYRYLTEKEVAFLKMSS